VTERIALVEEDQPEGLTFEEELFDGWDEAELDAARVGEIELTDREAWALARRDARR
jgi:hypothetical protein